MEKGKLIKSDFTLTQNRTGALSRIASYKVSERSVLVPRTDRPFGIYLVNKYTESGVDIDGATASVTVTEDLPDTPDLSVDGGQIVGYGDDSGTGFERMPVDSVNYFNETTPNQITFDTSALSGTSQDVKVFHVFIPGHVLIGAAPEAGQGKVELTLADMPLNKLHRRSQMDQTAPYLGQTIDLPDNWELFIKLESSVQISWESDGFNSYIEIPVRIKSISQYEAGREELEKRAIDQLIST